MISIECFSTRLNPYSTHRLTLECAKWNTVKYQKYCQKDLSILLCWDVHAHKYMAARPPWSLSAEARCKMRSILKCRLAACMTMAAGGLQDRCGTSKDAPRGTLSTQQRVQEKMQKGRSIYANVLWHHLLYKHLHMAGNSCNWLQHLLFGLVGCANTQRCHHNLWSHSIRKYTGLTDGSWFVQSINDRC